MRRTLDELVDGPGSAWPRVLEWLEEAGDRAVVLPRDPASSDSALERLQVTTRSVLGALAHGCGGVLVDSGWLRLLGGGPDLVDAATASGLDRGAVDPPPYVTVAYDVLGGEYALDGGALCGIRGQVCLSSAETLAWEPLGVTHSEFVQEVLVHGTDRLAGGPRWPGWQQEVAALHPSQGLSVYPPLFTAEGRADVADASRRAVPLGELLAFHEEMAEQLRAFPEGAAFQVHVDDGGRIRLLPPLA